MSKHRLLAVFVGALFAAASSGSFAQTSSLSGALRPDLGVKQERALYAKFRLEERYGIPFQPYASVCPKAAVGRMHCLAKIVTDPSGTPLSFDPAKQTLPGMTPEQLRAAYGVSGVAAGLPIIGIVDAYGDPTALSDLKTYSKQNKLPVLPKCDGDVKSSSVPCLQIVNQKGGNKLPATVDAGWLAEQSLDLAAVHALCENCSILLVEANTNGNGDMLPAENTAASLGANVISNSWGNSEFSVESGLDSYFTHPGIAITAAGGDNGYSAGLLWPAASPNVVSVGGTTLLMKKNNYKQEIAWSETGSGCSQYEARPSWQPALSGCPNNRTDNDISVDADPNTGISIYAGYQCTSDCWFELGGTSLSAPIVAALYAQAENVPANDSEAADLLYQNATSADLHDITKGSNGTCAFTYLCNALKGYDAPTGLGTPAGLGDF